MILASPPRQVALRYREYQLPARRLDVSRPQGPQGVGKDG